MWEVRCGKGRRLKDEGRRSEWARVARSRAAGLAGGDGISALPHAAVAPGRADLLFGVVVAAEEAAEPLVEGGRAVAFAAALALPSASTGVQSGAAVFVVEGAAGHGGMVEETERCRNGETK
jgi:hypothetical protein